MPTEGCGIFVSRPLFMRQKAITLTERKVIHAFCNGRTLMQQSNCWANEFAQIAVNDTCVLHAVLCMSATYVMDYHESVTWQNRANYHYRNATSLLNRALRDSDYKQPGKEDIVVTALNILTCHDVRDQIQDDAIYADGL